MSWPTKFDLNLIIGLSANVGKLLNQSDARPGNDSNSAEHDLKLIRPEITIMNVSTKFEINPLSHLSGNVQKPQKCDRRMDERMGELTDGQDHPYVPMDKKTCHSSPKGKSFLSAKSDPSLKFIRAILILMASCMTAVTSVLMHWSYCSFALSHLYTELIIVMTH